MGAGCFHWPLCTRSTSHAVPRARDDESVDSFVWPEDASALTLLLRPRTAALRGSFVRQAEARASTASAVSSTEDSTPGAPPQPPSGFWLRASQSSALSHRRLTIAALAPPLARTPLGVERLASA